MLAAMAGAHDTDVCSITNEAVAVKWMVALGSRTYGEDQMRERESGGAWVVAGHGRAHARRRTAAMAVMATWNVASPRLEQL